MQDDPYAEFRSEPNSNLMSVLVSLADELEAANARVAAVEAELEQARNEAKDIAEFRIPQATDGMEGKFNLGDGRELQVKEEIRASIAGEKAVPAIKWLDDNDYGHIVKRQVIVEIGKDDDKRAKKIIEALAALKDDPEIGVLNIKTKNNVHPMTLVSFVKEQLGEGVDLPVETFGIFRQRTAKIKGEKE